MGLEELLDQFAGQTDSDVAEYANQIEVSQVASNLITRLKEKLISQASSEGEKKKIEEDSKKGCIFFHGKEDELAELLEEDFVNSRGLPFCPPVMRKSECGCEESLLCRVYGA